ERNHELLQGDRRLVVTTLLQELECRLVIRPVGTAGHGQLARAQRAAIEHGTIGTIHTGLFDRLQPLIDEKARIIEHWIKQGKMDPIDPYHLFFIIWAATQTYADFGEQAAIVKGKRQLTKADFDTAADTITAIVLKGTGMVGAG
ncbi:MAG: TetR family transcriptional regulator C-terminal domain-containing protein, partial [Acidobacteria bacterium]|nr:TetR family transcriptional regulator C-terminal domain-containing protein [Acidobacteriota bacterium]